MQAVKETVLGTVVAVVGIVAYLGLMAASMALNFLYLAGGAFIVYWAWVHIF